MPLLNTSNSNTVFAPANLNNVLGGNAGFNSPAILTGGNFTQPTGSQASVIQPAQTGISVSGGAPGTPSVTTSNGDGTTTTTTATGSGGGGQSSTATPSGGATTTTPITDASGTADAPIYKKWWFYALIAGGLLGGYFLIKKVGK